MLKSKSVFYQNWKQKNPYMSQELKKIKSMIDVYIQNKAKKN